MTPIICPRCGSEATIAVDEHKISENEPIQQTAAENTQNEETSFEAKLPIYCCRHCEKDFGGDHTPFEKATTQFCLNTLKKGDASQALTFTKTSTGATIEGPFLCYYPDLPEIYINHEEWERLLSAFYDLYVLDWQTDYSDSDSSQSETSFAFSWDLKIKFDNREAITSKGENAYPPYWQSLMELFVSFGLPNIGKKLGQNFLQLGTAR